jgi:hypothetical protein
MIEELTRTIFGREDDWEANWNRVPLVGRSSAPSAFRDIAHYVGGALFYHGFKLFENGGMPLIERRTGSYREEILFVPAPKMQRRPDIPFAVRIHLSSTEVARIRSRYWRPATRAPHVVASGDIGQLLSPDRRILWSGIGELETAQVLIDEIFRTVLPWFRCFSEPTVMRERLFAGTLPWVDDCTALELLLSEFDPFEARRYLMRMIRQSRKAPSYAEPGGFDLTEDRIGPITAYYRL